MGDGVIHNSGSCPQFWTMIHNLFRVRCTVIPDGVRAGVCGSEAVRSVKAVWNVAETILIVTEDEELLDDLLRLCAAAGAEADDRARRTPGCSTTCCGCAPRLGRSRRRGSRRRSVLGRRRLRRAPPLVLGRRRRGRAAAAAAPRRPGCCSSAGTWTTRRLGARRRASAPRACCMLPDAESWLADRIADAAEGVGRPALTVGVIGGRGGAGASTLACALAVTAARHGAAHHAHRRRPARRRPGRAARRRAGEGTALAGVRGVAGPGRRRGAGGVAARAARPERAQLGPGGLGGDPARRRCGRCWPPRGGAAAWSSSICRGGSTRRVAEALAQLDLGLLVVPAELRAVAAAHRVALAVRHGAAGPAGGGARGP